MAKYKLAVIGSRDFDDYEFLKSVLDPIRDKISLIVSGGAKGADSLAERYADERGIVKKILLADWNTHGKKAGYLRNKEIIDSCDAVIAFWDGASKGTKHSLDLAGKEGKPFKIIKYK